MRICPSCKFLNADQAEECTVCKARFDELLLTEDHLTVRSLGTPPQARLPAPMVEPIAPVATGPPAPEGSGTALTRGLSEEAAPEPAAVTLRESDAIRNQLRDEPAANRPPQAGPRLVVIRGERLDVAYPVLEGRNYIGRCAEQPVDIDLGGQEPVERIWTSRQHAIVTWEGGALVIEDLNSLNGTFVNRTRIHPGQRQALQAGDIIQVGIVQLRVAF